MVKWVLTICVILDGIFISLALQPGWLPRAGTAWTMKDIQLFLSLNLLPRNVITECLLWSWCLTHWLTNIYVVEMREHGVLSHAGFVPWPEMSRLGWSSVHSSKLVYYRRGHIGAIAIDPSSRDAVEAVLNKVRAGAETA